MLEVELKAEIEKDEEVINKLKKLNPTKIERVVYEDIYFDTSDKQFSKSERELRIRKISGEQNICILTYKDKPFHKESKSKPEYEVRIHDNESMKKILERLGYKIDIKFKKMCKNYYMNYNSYSILATLVKIPEIRSNFIELEIQVKSIAEVDLAVMTLHDLLKFLCISKDNLTTEYYTTLIRNARANRSD
jgi:adenylate cyclase class 2